MEYWGPLKIGGPWLQLVSLLVNPAVPPSNADIYPSKIIIADICLPYLTLTLRYFNPNPNNPNPTCM